MEPLPLASGGMSFASLTICKASLSRYRIDKGRRDAAESVVTSVDAAET
jgi:hypothetical protein